MSNIKDRRITSGAYFYYKDSTASGEVQIIASDITKKKISYNYYTGFIL